MEQESEITIKAENVTIGIIKGVSSQWKTISLILSLCGVGLFSHVDAKKTVWNETGDHILDTHNEVYSNMTEMKALELRVIQLEQHQTTNYNVNTF